MSFSFTHSGLVSDVKHRIKVQGLHEGCPPAEYPLFDAAKQVAITQVNELHSLGATHVRTQVYGSIGTDYNSDGTTLRTLGLSLGVTVDIVEPAVIADDEYLDTVSAGGNPVGS